MRGHSLRELRSPAPAEEPATPRFTLQLNPASHHRKGDRTHFTPDGARAMAALVAADLGTLDARLKLAVRPAQP